MAVIFWGATGQAKVLRDALSNTGWQLVALFDNRDIPSPFADVPIFHGEAGFVAWEHGYSGASSVRACVAIAGMHGEERLDRMRWLEKRGYAPFNIVHSRAFVARDTRIGSGCQVLAMSAVCAGVSLGDAVIVNTNASVDHDCVIGNGVHIAPGATIAGEVIVENFAFIGSGATILPRVHIGSHAVIGAGAVVTRDVSPAETVIGNPAQTYRKEES